VKRRNATSICVLFMVRSMPSALALQSFTADGVPLRTAKSFMATLDFYALGDDARQLLEFLYSETDVVVYELGSRPNCDLRRFDSIAEVAEAYELGGYRTVHLTLWSPSVTAHPVIERIQVTKVSEPYFRYAIRGGGLIQLYLDGMREGAIHYSHFGHWNEAGARRRSTYPASDCNWPALRKLSGKIQRHIRSKLAAAKLRACPVLHQAFAMLQQGHGLWFPGATIHQLDSPHIQTIARKGA
jgi:hypothetical protein